MKYTLITIIGAISVASGTVIISDNFTSNTIDYGFRVEEQDIDGNWQAGSQGGGSAWMISGGNLSNSDTTNLTGYPNYIPSEGPAAFLASVSGVPATDTEIEISFDYSVAAGDSLNVFLIAHTGTFTGSAEWVGNVEPQSSYGAAGGVNASDTVTFDQVFSTTIVGASAGTFSNTFDITTAGIAGVSSVADLTGVTIAFAKVEDGLAGTTSISNVNVSSIPEPTSGALLGLGTLGLLARRRR